MSLKASNKIDTNKYELEIAIDSASFCDAIQKVYKKEAKNITVKGFRKGKAPLHMIEKLYGEAVFFDDALNYLYEGALLGAVEEANLKLVDVDICDIEFVENLCDILYFQLVGCPIDDYSPLLRMNPLDYLEIDQKAVEALGMENIIKHHPNAVIKVQTIIENRKD